MHRNAMKNASVKKTIRNFAAAAIAFGCVTAAVSTASAFQIDADKPAQPEAVMAYADPNFAARFGNAPDVQESADHELNDAWLGMTVVATNGEKLGYVIDAIIGVDGQVTDLVITDDPNSEIEVFVPARLATLTDTNVNIALSSNDVAALRTAYNSVFASNN